MKCTFQKNINSCSFFNPETEECTNAKKCSFQEEVNSQNNKYIRKERWYEKYYKNNKS